MKLSLISVCLFAMVGCASRQLPPQNYGITETFTECANGVCDKITRTTYPNGTSVTVRPIHDPPKVVGTTIPSAPTESDNPYETEEDRRAEAEAKEEANRRLHEAMKKAVEKDTSKKDSCMCIPGDPLCSCL